jgi:hypothetical protein
LPIIACGSSPIGCGNGVGEAVAQIAVDIGDQQRQRIGQHARAPFALAGTVQGRIALAFSLALLTRDSRPAKAAKTTDAATINSSLEGMVKAGSR